MSSDIATTSYIWSDSKIKYLSYSLIPLLSLTWIDHFQISPSTQSNNHPHILSRPRHLMIAIGHSLTNPPMHLKSASGCDLSSPLLADLVRRPHYLLCLPSSASFCCDHHTVQMVLKLQPSNPICSAAIAEVASLSPRILVSSSAQLPRASAIAEVASLSTRLLVSSSAQLPRASVRVCVTMGGGSLSNPRTSLPIQA